MKHNRRTFLLWFIVILACVALILYGFQRYTNNLLVQQTGKRLTAIATMATTEFSITDLDQLHFAGDMRTEAYQRVFRKLNEIRNKNPEIKFAYIFRPVDSAGMFEFVADADANFDLPFLMKYDINDTGPPTQANENVYPGLRYFDNNGAFSSAMKNPGYDINSDKWGKIVSGASPIFDTQGRAAALLGFDVDLDKIAE